MAFKIPTQPIQDDRAPTVIKFIEERYQLHRFEHPNTPFFIGLNGVQGAGKTTLVKNLENALMEKGWETLVFSIDDFYLRREDQIMLAKLHSSNMLVQHRGEPGTHDMGLARKVFADLKEGKEVRIPQYEKKWFNGQGDRVREDFWYRYNGKDQK
jgi:D-glycerate 3-kinase